MLKRNIDKLEAIERRATKFILKSNEDYNTRLSLLNKQRLFNRRFARGVVFLLNLINGHYNIDISNQLSFCKDRNLDYDLRKNDTLDLVCMYSETNSFNYSYFIRIINLNRIACLMIQKNLLVFLVLSTKLYHFFVIVSHIL